MFVKLIFGLTFLQIINTATILQVGGDDSTGGGFWGDDSTGGGLWGDDSTGGVSGVTIVQVIQVKF